VARVTSGNTTWSTMAKARISAYTVGRIVIYYRNKSIGYARTYDAAAKYIIQQGGNARDYHIYDSKYGLVWSL
jgi:hypothetical protein